MGITIGLYYNGARYLAAWLGRWTSADPIGIGADGPGLYNYTRGSPVNYTDPSGTEVPEEPEAPRVDAAGNLRYPDDSTTWTSEPSTGGGGLTSGHTTEWPADWERDHTLPWPAQELIENDVLPDAKLKVAQDVSAGVGIAFGAVGLGIAAGVVAAGWGVGSVGATAFGGGVSGVFGLGAAAEYDQREVPPEEVLAAASMGAGTSVGVPAAVSAVGKGVGALLSGISKPLAARLASPFTAIGGLGGGGPSKGPSNIIAQRDNGTIKLPSSPEARAQLSIGVPKEASRAVTPPTPRDLAGQRGAELVGQFKEEGLGSAVGRSGGHGVPMQRAGAELIREANKLSKNDPLRDALKIEGQRLIARGKGTSHR